MSIWCSLPVIGFDEFDDPVGQVRSYANGWSNHYPTTDGVVERDATINLAYIPAWCAGGPDDDFESVGPWVRLGVRSYLHDMSAPTETARKVEAVVVMDEDAVRVLVGELNQWLDRPKVSRDRLSGQDLTHG
jgi:hypothetical protein